MSDQEEDVDYESEDELGGVGALKAKLQKLRDELAVVKKERQEYLDGWQRCKADSVNARRDVESQSRRTVERERENFVEQLLPVLDGFDMAKGVAAWDTIDETWRQGIDHIRNQLLEVLSRNGISQYGRIGDVVDPQLHETLQEVNDAPGEPGSVVRVLRSGYKTAERVIRPAQVIIKTIGSS